MSVWQARTVIDVPDGADWRVLRSGRGSDWVISHLAAMQHGVVGRAQLIALGVSGQAIAWRLKQGRLHPVHRGVYLVGHTVAPAKAMEMAAVLACGEFALISHRSAAALWQIVAARPGDLIEVTVTSGGHRERPGIRVHRSRTIAPKDIRKLERIPLTSPARTLLDLATVATPRVLEQAISEAESRRLVRRSELRALLDRASNVPGSAALRSALEQDGGPALTRSQAEERLLGLIRAARLPSPDTNINLAGFEVDFVWPDQKLVVEVDGYRFHSSRAAFERDRRRDAKLGELGFRVIRVTWRQLVDEPHAVVAGIAAALARA